MQFEFVVLAGVWCCVVYLLDLFSSYPTVNLLVSIAPLLILIVSGVSALLSGRRLSGRVEAYCADSSVASRSSLKGKTLLVLLNPHGGTKSAPRIYENILKPMAAAVGVRLDLVETQRAGHANELVGGIKPGQYAAVVCISGDGMLHEAVQSIMKVPKAERTPLAILPGGTSNGMCMSLVKSVNPFDATKALIEGKIKMIDAYSVVEGDKSGGQASETIFDTHVLSWAIVAQANDLMERRLRWLGMRQVCEYIVAVYVICYHKTWFGRISFCPVEVTQEDREPRIGYRDPSALPADGSAKERRVIDGPIRFFCIVNVEWGSHDSILCPGLGSSAGYMDILVARTPSRWELLKGFLALDTGSHVSQPAFERYRVSEVQLRDTGGKRLKLDVSGEEHSVNHAHVQCLPREIAFWC